MKIAFLNLCHCDPDLVARAAGQLTRHPDFDMYIHVDQKSDITPFQEAVSGMKQVYFVKKRRSVYWGGFHAILATLELMKEALHSEKKYDRFVLLQNLDYPIKSNQYIYEFFSNQKDTEFIRACKIASCGDWHFEEKYRMYHSFDDDFYLKEHNRMEKILHDGLKILKSSQTIGFNGVIKDGGEEYPIYYGTAQWALTRNCVRYILNFYNRHSEFNRRMRHIKFPDEEYFHTIVHNSEFAEHCLKKEEPLQRWLVNWRNIHYFEYPKEITVFTEKDFSMLMDREELFIRKVRSGVSDELLNKIDERLEN